METVDLIDSPYSVVSTSCVCVCLLHVLAAELECLLSGVVGGGGHWSDAVTQSPPRVHMCVHTAKMAASFGLFSTLDQCHSGSSHKLRGALFLTAKHTFEHSFLPNLQ